MPDNKTAKSQDKRKTGMMPENKNELYKVTIKKL